MTSGPDLGGALRPVRQGNAFEETVERLLDIIKLGLVPAGGRLPPERELAARLGISRLTLREALGELARAGFVCSRRGRSGGTFVTWTPPAPGRDELRRLAREDGGRLADALTFRLAVEVGAAEILAGLIGAPPGQDSAGQDSAGQDSAGRDSAGRDSAGQDGPRAVLAARLAEVTAAGPADYRRLDTRFHLAIAELTGSSLLLQACTDARVRLNGLLNAIPVLPRNIENTAAQHAAIVTAILAGDAPAARAAVAEHLAGTASLLRGFLG